MSQRGNDLLILFVIFKQVPQGEDNPLSDVRISGIQRREVTKKLQTLQFSEIDYILNTHERYILKYEIINGYNS